MGIFRDHVYATNSLDEQIIWQIEAEIDNYEKNGIIVTKVAVQKVESATPSYPQADTGYYLFVHKALYDIWGDVELLNYFTGRGYEEIEMDGDTLYWAIY